MSCAVRRAYMTRPCTRYLWQMLTNGQPICMNLWAILCVVFFSAVFYSTLSGNFYTGCSIPFNLFSQLVLSIQKCLLACGQWRIKKNHIGIIIHIDARMAYTNDLSLIACKYSSFAFGFIGFSSLIETIRIFMPRMKWNKIRKIERVVGRPCCEQRKLPVLRRALCRRWNLSKIWLWVVYG